ncbi:hypothetical protein MW887_007167 [Aspergillus wentii]|nr:hypothetical protein MW887_007167 [Aspergillus wentii]
MLSPIAISILFAALVKAQNHTHHRTIHIPSSAPDSAVAVPEDFFSFGFESAFLPNFNNDFSDNVVNSVGSRMSKPLIIRIGGTGGDLVLVNDDLKNATKCIAGPSCPKSSKDTFELGPAYFDGFKRFQKAAMTIQAPIGDKNYTMENTMAYIRHAWEALGQDRVAAIALGNEPNFYDYGVQEYVNRALNIMGNVTEEFNLKGDAAKIFQAGEISDKGSATNHPFGLADVFKSGINKNGGIKSAAEHYYQVGKKLSAWDSKAMQSTIMNHSYILEHLAPYEQAMSDIKNQDVPFVLSEVGSVLGGAPIKFSGGFGAAMWAVDMHLAAMARGIQRVTNTERPEAAHAFWVPDTTGPPTKRPVVQGVFPAAPFIADFVGKDGKVVEIPLKGGNELFTAYAMYNQQTSKVDKVALINLKQWDESSKAHRGSATITLNVGNDVKSAIVQRMKSRKGSSAVGFDLGGAGENVTWAGEQWTYAVDQGKGHFIDGHKVEEQVKVNNGKVVVHVPDTEAVIVFFN